MQQSQNSPTWGLWIEGQVQGVGYRRFTLKIGLQMSLTGWVRNLNDGRVEARVNGTNEQIQAFVDRLKKSPPPSRVEKIEIKEMPNELFADFQIRRDI